ncbi:MAG: LEA type 2 family protein [candidate division WOR-3 bacterium]
MCIRKSLLLFLLLITGCSFLKERIAIKECTFKLKQVRPYDFTLTDLKLDLTVNIQNPNKIDAVLDRLDYSLSIAGENVFTGVMGQRQRIPAGKSKDILTTVVLNYQSVSMAIIKAIKEGNPTYSINGRAYIDTPGGSINYPVNISL